MSKASFKSFAGVEPHIKYTLKGSGQPSLLKSATTTPFVPIPGKGTNPTPKSEEGTVVKFCNPAGIVTQQSENTAGKK